MQFAVSVHGGFNCMAIPTTPVGVTAVTSLAKSVYDNGVGYGEKAIMGSVVGWLSPVLCSPYRQGARSQVNPWPLQGIYRRLLVGRGCYKRVGRVRFEGPLP